MQSRENINLSVRGGATPLSKGNTITVTVPLLEIYINKKVNKDKTIDLMGVIRFWLVKQKGPGR